jgi:hypothetical protein
LFNYKEPQGPFIVVCYLFLSAFGVATSGAVKATLLKYQLLFAVRALLGSGCSVFNISFESTFYTVLPGVDVV